MDNLTHSLVGLALSRAGLSRFSPHATALLVLSANAPDGDIAALISGPLPYFEAHRGYTHAVIAMPVMAALSMVVVSAVFRSRLPWGRAFSLCMLGVLSHLLLDWTNNYGIRLLLPFSSEWFHLDWNSLYDVVLWIVLAVAAVWPWFSRLVSSEIGDKAEAGRGIARFALLFFLLYDGARAALHHRAVAQLETRLYDAAAPLSVAAFPDAFNPFAWTGAVESARAHFLYPPNPGGDVATGDARVFYKIPQTPEIEAARRAEPFRYFTYFARFPVWSEESMQMGDRRGKRIEMTDLRFGQPGAGAFHAMAEADEHGRILRAWFTYAAPPPD